MRLDAQRSRTGEEGQEMGQEYCCGGTRYPDFLAGLVDVGVETEPLVGRNCCCQGGGMNSVDEREDGYEGEGEPGGEHGGRDRTRIRS